MSGEVESIEEITGQVGLEPFRGFFGLEEGATVEEMRSLSPLPEDAQKLVDDEVVRVGTNRLTFVRDLFDEGLVVNLDNPLSVLNIQSDKITNVGAAREVMDPEDEMGNFLEDRTPFTIPIHLTMEGFKLGIRTILASRRTGQPIDLSQIAQATTRVNERIEFSALNGTGLVVQGNQAFGITNEPNVNPFTLPLSWTNVAINGPLIISDIISMVELAQNDLYFGPYNLYIGTKYGLVLSEDYRADYAKTIRARIEELEYGGRNIRIRVVDFLADDTVVLVQMTSNVVDVINGMSPTVFSWTSGSNWTTHNRVMAIIVTRVKSDVGNGSGITVGTV